jgi:hypothetical protein
LSFSHWQGFVMWHLILVSLDTNNLKKHALSIFRARSDQVGGNIYLCKIFIIMPISWHYAYDLSWYKAMMYKFMCLLKKMCFHLGTTSDYIWYYGRTQERLANEEEFDRMWKAIHYEFIKDWGKIQNSPKVSCSIGHSHCQGPVSLPGDQSIWDL